MGAGWFDGIGKFIEVERAVLATAPERRMRVDPVRATDDVVIVEAAVVDGSRGPDWEIPFCAVLEIRDDKIAVDRTYTDFSDWPGPDL